jgi:hypothetical protein
MMNLSDVGQLADKFWIEIPDHYPGVILDTYIVMPNHMHGILVINKRNGKNRVVAGMATTRIFLATRIATTRGL